MTVDIVRAEHNAVAALDATNDALERLAAWVDAASNARRLVAPLVDTPFVPDNYRPKVDPRATPEQKREAYEIAVATATAAVLQGLSLGIDPLMALQQIYVVHGRPGMYAKMMVALVQSHGHEVWDEDLTDTRAVVAGRRRGTDNIVRITVTMDQARKAGWATRNDNYAKTPQDMLWARAASRVCDRIASDVLKGLASVEAIQDELSTPTGNGTRTVAPRPAIQATASVEPPLDDEETATALTPEPAAGPGSTDEPPITQAQQRKLHALLRERFGNNRDAGLVYLSGVVERELTTTNDLSKAEATACIDDLLAAPADEPPLDEPDVPQPGGQ